MTHFRILPDRDRPSGWKILEVAGIPFYVEPSFLLFALVIVMLQAQTSRSLSEGGLLAMIIFFSLLVHEAGHALVARSFRLWPIQVSLVAFGGFTRHPPTTHGRSLAIVLAGPVGSLLMAGLGWSLLTQPSDPSPALRLVASYLFFLNLFWLIFNLLPIYPMDGGQLLFHALALRVRPARALYVVAFVSLATCIAAGAWLFWAGWANFFLILFLVLFIKQNVDLLRSLPRY